MSYKFPACAAATTFALLLSATIISAKKHPQIQQDNSSTPEPQQADGRRHGRPAETYAVAPGTKFLVVLEQDLTSKDTAGKRQIHRQHCGAARGGQRNLPAARGGNSRPHQPRGVRRTWPGAPKSGLTFDDIYTKFGKLPIVAEVVSVPGDHSVKSSARNQEGIIEGRSSSQQDAAQSAAAGAANGAVKGVKNKDKKEAAEGAALGALTAYLIESGRGHELNLPKGAKLELEIGRALYLLKE